MGGQHAKAAAQYALGGLSMRGWPLSLAAHQAGMRGRLQVAVDTSGRGLQCMQMHGRACKRLGRRDVAAARPSRPPGQGAVSGGANGGQDQSVEPGQHARAPIQRVAG
eukprot:364610-Chlamydomonas_euryale.AAC.6